jgi:ketosteroid isomerase-like protein
MILDEPGRRQAPRPRHRRSILNLNEDMTMPDDAVAIARASYDAYVTKDRAAIEALIADDFHFTSPLDNRLDRATYFARCWPNSESIEGFDFIHLVPDGERVFVTYEGRGGGRCFRNTEILTVKDGRITDAEVYFGWTIPHDARPGGFVDAAP